MPEVASFTDIIKILIMLIETTYKDQVKVKRIRKNVSKCNFCLYFMVQQKLLISGEKMLMSAEL